MTIIELFPWLLALCVTLLSAAALQRNSFPNVLSVLIGLGLGIFTWLTVVWGGKRAVSWLEKVKTAKEKAERERRQYQAFDSTKQYPASKDLFYECLVCGNTIPSLPKKTTTCKCHNITVHADSGGVEIRVGAKVKLFSRSHAPG